MPKSSELHYWVCLGTLPGLGPIGIARLVDHFGSPGRIFQARPDELKHVPGVRQSQIEPFRQADYYLKLSERLIANARDGGITILAQSDPRFPSMLLEIPDPPAVLYCRGDLSAFDHDSIAIVGSRAATGYGRRVARDMGHHLAANSLAVVSGMALGVDSEAHVGALEAAGMTIAVLGCGLDIVYPRQNHPLFERLCQSGLVVSEYPLGTKPESFRFPARNRIIAGLSKGVVVVEAARKSGSLITAQMALDFGREVFAVPGQADSFKSEGTHWLIRQGAQLVIHGDDILSELGVAAGQGSGAKGNNGQRVLSGLDPDAVALLNQLDPYPVTRDELGQQAGMTASRISELLLYLELEGCVELLSGDRIQKIVE